MLICGQLARYTVPLTKIEAVAGRWWAGCCAGITSSSSRAARWTGQALKATWEVLADGDISRDLARRHAQPGRPLQQAKEGLAFVARQAPDAWLIPCAVTGTPQFTGGAADQPAAGRADLWPALPPSLAAQRRWRVALPEGRDGRETLREMTDEAMAQLAALLAARDARRLRGQADPGPASGWSFWRKEVTWMEIDDSRR